MEGGDSGQSVRVAVNIRPLVTSELLVGCTDCVTVYPVQKQVQLGSHAFTFDNIFGSKGCPSSSIYPDCVAPLIDALFNGYNGTVLAYGQTGSGKTYTMGTNYNGEEQRGGVIPQVMDSIFSKVEAMKDSTEFLIRVSFIEIFKEEVFDLLDPNPPTISKSDIISMVKTTGPARVPIQIRERVSGGITLAGVTEAEVRTKEEMASYLLQGSLCRATASTNMNSQSSRSHAIFTISLEQRRTTHSSIGDDVGDDVLIAKLHLVDLAGSERAKRTGADGTRLQEGIHINKGLLALGNVISALGDEKKRKEGGHVPYRDSKLTRILQDSLGGNCKTVMIACISPADTNVEETLNTLKYANRARNIQNKAIINRDPATAQLQRMRNEMEQLQAELLYLRGDSSAPSSEEIKILKHKVSLLEASKMELLDELEKSRISYEHLTQRAIDAQVERDRLIMKIKSAQNGKALDENGFESDKDFDMLKSYVTKIQELEDELIRIRNSNRLRQETSTDYHSPEEDDAIEIDGVVEDVEKELEHSTLQEKLDMELKELDKRLEQKEAEMKRFAGSDTSVLKQHYEKKVQDLEQEKRALQKEIGELRKNLSHISCNSDDSAQKLKEEYLQKLNVLETQVAQLKKKQDAQAQLLRQKQKSDEAAKRLQDEIHRIKTQKVQLQQKIKQESEQFRQWKASREKEVLQLKKEGRRNEYEMHKLLALNQRQKQVLQRKTEEAAMATKRLKDLLDTRKASREAPGAASNKSHGIQALIQTIEHELEVSVGVHEVRSEYERQERERAKMAEELARLREEALFEKQNLSEGTQIMSPGARNSRVFALENMLATYRSALNSMRSDLTEADERERAFSSNNKGGRWNQVKSLAEAKPIMNFLFNLAVSSRCQLRDKEVDCREKDSDNRDLKEKVVNLVRQLEAQKTEFKRKEMLMKLAMERQSIRMKEGSENSYGHVYDLRPMNRTAILSEEDMDTSDDDYQLDNLREFCDEDTEWELTKERKRRPMKKRNSKTDSHLETTYLQPEQSNKGVCCSCSKSSSCKTSRCECRAGGGHCGLSCSCEPTRCSNRTEEAVDKGLVQPELNEHAGNMNITKTNKNDRNNSLASHGAALLQNALSEKPVNTNDGGGIRRPLSDIGNNLATAPKPNIRKKWGKSAIQLVPATPTPQPTSQDQAQTAEVSGPFQSSNNVEVDIPLPRSIRTSATINNQLKERNSDQPNQSVNNDDACTSPRQQARAKNGKENKGM